VKRDGKKQVFMPGKIRKAIEMAAKDIGMPIAKRKELIREVAEPVIKHYKNKRTRASALRKAVLGRIDRRAKAVSVAWRRHDRKKHKK